MILGVAVDVTVFKNLSPHYFQILGSDPIFTAFLVTMLQLLKDIPPQNHFSFICDDEEEAAIHMFKLYRRVKLIVPGARDTLAAISFADDRFLFGLQAADIVSSLMRQEAGKKFFGIDYDFAPLFLALSEEPKPHENIRALDIAFCDKPKLMKLADDLKKEKEGHSEAAIKQRD
jgi:hypothetical protein